MHRTAIPIAAQCFCSLRIEAAQSAFKILWVHISRVSRIEVNTLIVLKKILNKCKELKCQHMLKVIIYSPLKEK
jgi:hypothetical protein